MMFAAAAFNHLLAGESWARADLGRFSGKTARILLPPFSFSFTVGSDGRIEKAAAGQEIDTLITLKPGALFSYKDASIEGDAEFARAIDRVAKNLRWDFEEDLSAVSGDIVAHRVASLIKSFAGWQKESAERLLKNFAEYWTEERPLIARGPDVARFNEEVDALRDAAARLEKRLAKLMPKP